jgi:ketosteroid isomerase-like protein
MSQEAVEVVRGLYEKASRVKDPSGRRLDALDPETLAVVFEDYHPDVEIKEDPRFPEAGVYRGSEAVQAYFKQFTESFDEFILEAEDFIDAGDDRMLFLFRLLTRGTGSGAAAEARPGWIYNVRDGKVVRIEAYLDRDDALAAAGVGGR